MTVWNKESSVPLPPFLILLDVGRNRSLVNKGDLYNYRATKRLTQDILIDHQLGSI